MITKEDYIKKQKAKRVLFAFIIILSALTIIGIILSVILTIIMCILNRGMWKEVYLWKSYEDAMKAIYDKGGENMNIRSGFCCK